jgi:predicted dehydrogenase
MPPNDIGGLEVTERLDPVSWGVLSTADIGLKKVIPAMMAGSMTSVDAIASRSEDRAADAASRLGISKAYGSYEALLGDPEIEAVYIPLPNHLHAEWTIAAAEAGKHVLCEKPLAMTAADARRMIDACTASDVLLMEAFMYRLHPMWIEVKNLVDDGAIGELRSVQIAFSYFNDDPGNIRNIPEVGGGALYDIGCYAVSASRWLLGSEPTKVKAVIRRDESFGTDVVTSAVLDFDGRHAGFVCSTQMESDQRVDIHGTEGRIAVEIPFNIPPDIPTRILVIAGGDPPVSPGIEVHEFPAADPYTVQADDFSRAVRSGSPAPVPPEDAVANLEVIERIFADADR